MDMGMLGVPVVDRDPIEAGVEILFHLRDEITGEGPEIGHVDGIVGRDDESEMVAIVLTPLREGLRIGVVTARSEEMGFLSITGHALAAQIVEVGGKRRGASRVTHDARLDDGATRAGREQPVRLDACTLSAPEARAVSRCDPARARDAGSGLLRRDESLRDEGTGLLRTR